MDGADAGGGLAAGPAFPGAEEAIAAVRDDAYGRPRTPSDGDKEEDYDDLYGDVNVGFIPLLPPSPSPAPTSPPKTPSPGCSILSLSLSPSPPPRRAPAPEPPPQREPAAQQPEPAAPRHQPPRPPSPHPPAPPRHHVPPQTQRPPRGGGVGGGASYSSPPRYTSLYISELHWWTTDAEVEAALNLAPHGALCGLHFYSDKYTGKSRGICRAEFLNAAAAASAAATLHGHAFHGRHCVASLDRPPALHRLSDDSDSFAEAAPAPNPTRGLGNCGRGATNATTVRGNVGDRPAPPPLPVVPQQSPRPPFGGIMGGVGGYGGFQSIGHYNAGVGTGTVSSVVAPHVNPSFLAAGAMAMRGPGVWHDRGMAGSLWSAQHGWNFRGYQMPWQPLMPPLQQYGNGRYGKGRVIRRERPGNRSEERGIGNVCSPDRRQSDRDEVDWYKEHDHEEKGRHRERVVEKERGGKRHWSERDRYGSDKRRHQDYNGNSGNDDDDNDRPRRRH
ncbi:hypothetical protein HU200_032187 [Digitaria exilis]|uniref:RRM domain-containing protein n=1 Tax=Digitaria exilis TaxID=1010633 RepID=A0A835BTX3_9POAL|nr:hypothetical protein HU200_032187 [Digitaria exilis]